jgi:hypothetical protein
LHGNPDTPEGRHLHANFRSSCDQCSGWGYVLEGDDSCVHGVCQVPQRRQVLE